MSKIYITDCKCFKYAYPNWSETVNNKYTRLPKEKFIIKYPNTDKVVAIDNSNYNAWTEEFNSLKEAYLYLKGE